MMLATAQFSEGLNRAGGFPPRVVHSSSWQVSTASWQKDSVPHYKDLSLGLLECPHKTANFHQSKRFKRMTEASVSFTTTLESDTP